MSPIQAPSCNVRNDAMPQAARVARLMAGIGFLVLAGALATREPSGAVALWPLAIVPTWFGISHLIAGVIGYRGCPELGAIPSVMLGRTVPTSCRPWDRLDQILRLGK